ncbi:MAG: YggT family protein [Chloroflexi bacterium]|nr:YggT family protein [Chloroflexota bacterium]
MFLYSFIDFFFTALTVAILIRVVLSWFGLPPDNRLLLVLHDITEPVLAPLRRVIPSLGFLDITPIIALFLLQIIREFLLRAIPPL